jgi:hypothetical protein
MDTTSTSGAQAAEQMQTGASGYDAAQQPQTPAATAAPSAGGGPPTAVPAGGAQPASSGAPPAAAAQPTVLTPVKRGGLLGVVDGIADVLAGKTRPEIAKDQDGNAYVKNVSLSRGEQWERIGAEAFTGAMKGMAAGKGAGNLGKAGAAGVDQGEEMAKQRQQQEKDMTAEARQQTLDNANRQMLTMKQTEQAWQANRNQIEATQHDIEFSQKQEDRLTKPIAEGGEGGQVLGIMHGPDDLRHILKVDPNVMDALVKKGTIRTPYHIGPDGKIDGMTVIKMPDDYGKEVVPTGTEFPTWNSVTQGYDWHKTAAGQVTTKRDIDNYWDAAGVKGLDERNKVAEIHQKEEAAKESDAKIANAPGEAAHTRAETRQANAGADKDEAQTAQLKSGAVQADGTPNPRFEAMAQALYDGDVLPADLKREAKGANLDPNEVMARAVEIGNASGHPWSAPIIEQENKFAASPKTQAALDGIDRIIGKPGDATTGYMAQMLNAAQKADLGTNGAFNSTGLAVKRFFGGTQAKNFETAVSETRRSIAGLIGNPLLGGGETDRKLQQADAMLGEKPTMENLKGAAALLKTALETQRTSMIGNNRFLQRRYAQGGAAAAAPPAGATAAVHDAGGKLIGYMVNGKYQAQ